MADEVFDGFDHTQHRDEVIQRWGRDAYASGDKWWRGMSEQDKQDFADRHLGIAADYGAARRSGLAPDSAEVLAIAKRHYDWIAIGWQGRRPISAGAEPAERPISAGAEPAERPITAGAESAERPISAGAESAERPISAGAEPAERPISAGAESAERPISAGAEPAERPISAEAFTGLGEIYVADPRFRANYDVHGEGTTEFVRDAMLAYALAHLT